MCIVSIVIWYLILFISCCDNFVSRDHSLLFGGRKLSRYGHWCIRLVVIIVTISSIKDWITLFHFTLESSNEYYGWSFYEEKGVNQYVATLAVAKDINTLVEVSI